MLYNLREYHRPTEVQEALGLLRRPNVRTAVLAGGTSLVGEGNPEVEAVVDLADLGLNRIDQDGDTLHTGATVHLQMLIEDLPGFADGLLAEAARRMGGWNLRNQATIGGVLAGQDIHSPLSVALNALNARAVAMGTEGEETLLWPFLPSAIAGKLITEVLIDLPAEGVGAGYAQVARTPADRPIVCAASVTVRQADGTVATRNVVGGLMNNGLVYVGDITVQPDSPDISPIDRIASDLEDTPLLSDYRGSAEYRRAVAPVLARRALATALAHLNLNVEG